MNVKDKSDTADQVAGKARENCMAYKGLCGHFI